MIQPANDTINKNITTSESMSVDEARKVLWVRPNNRPLGELLDEGYLDKTNLEWAAANAYNPKLKQAAQVLLDWLKQFPVEKAPEKKVMNVPSVLLNIPLTVNITLEQARATIWPFREYKGQPMGMLVDTRQLSWNDLGFAAEKARDDRVRQAALALLLIRLNQAVKEPAPSAGSLHVVSGGRSFALRMQFVLAYIYGSILGAMMALCTGVLIYLLTRPMPPLSQQIAALPNQLSSLAGIVALIIPIALTAAGYWLITFLLDRIVFKPLDRALDNYRKGQEGEDRVVEMIRQGLDGNWYLFRNIQLPGRKKTDLDAVLVGPSGIWTLEIKNFDGEYRNIGEQWEYRAGKRWKLHSKSPSRQARDHAVRLADFFRADNIKQWVTPAVVWANPESPLTVENPSAAVWKLDRLLDELGNIWQGETLAEPERNQIVEKLSKLCQRQVEEGQHGTN